MKKLWLMSIVMMVVGADSEGHAQAIDGSTASLELRETDAVISIVRGDTVVVAYNKQAPELPVELDAVYRRSGFLHPVSTPQGRVVTAVYPFDHAHQNGVFSAWVKTSFGSRAVNFWNHADQTGRVQHQTVVSRFRRPDAVGFEVELTHRIVAEPQVDVLSELWKVTAYDRSDDIHCFDLQLTQTALTDQPLVVHEYHYGGLALRGLVRWLSPDDRDLAGSERLEPSRMLNDRRSDQLQGNHQPARWVSLMGTIDGHDVSISVLVHADNFRAPQTARLHPRKPYFCFAPCVDGEFRIDKQHPYQARYRFLVTDTTPDPEWLDEQWRLWGK